VKSCHRSDERPRFRDSFVTDSGGLPDMASACSPRLRRILPRQPSTLTYARMFGTVAHLPTAEHSRAAGLIAALAVRRPA